MATETKREITDGERNAIGWLNRIVEARAADIEFERGEDAPVEYEGENYTDQDLFRQCLEEEALSVEVRSAWYAPISDQSLPPAEYRILLTWGGPACQITGELSEHGEPVSATLQWQDWGTPWTDVARDGCFTSEHAAQQRHLEQAEADDKAVLWYASLFYFGE